MLARDVENWSISDKLLSPAGESDSGSLLASRVQAWPTTPPRISPEVSPSDLGLLPVNTGHGDLDIELAVQDSATSPCSVPLAGGPMQQQTQFSVCCGAVKLGTDQREEG